MDGNPLQTPDGGNGLSTDTPPAPQPSQVFTPQAQQPTAPVQTAFEPIHVAQPLEPVAAPVTQPQSEARAFQSPDSMNPVAPITPTPSAYTLPDPSSQSAAQPVLDTTAAQLLYNTKSTKSAVTSIIAAVIAIGIVAAAILWVLATRSGISFTPLTTRQGKFYTISIPEEWNEEQGNDNVLFFDGDTPEESQATIALDRGEVTTDYANASESQKDQHIKAVAQEVETRLRSALTRELKTLDNITIDIKNHPNSDRAIRFTFEGTNANDLKLNGLAYYFIDDSGRVYFLRSISTSKLWATNNSDIEKILNSFKPAEK